MDRKVEMNKYYKFGLYLVIVILINLVALNLFFRIDLTSNRLYSLSSASKQAVSTLKEPLTINVFFSQNLPAPYNNIERYLHDLLEEYAIHGKRFFSFRFFNVSAKEGDLSDSAEENRKKAQDYGIYPVNVQTIEADQASVQRAYMGMVLIHGDIVEKIPSVTSTEGLEYKITATIRKLNNKVSALLNLKDKITVRLVQSASLSDIAPIVGLDGLNDLRGEIARVVEEMNAKTYNQLQLATSDPAGGDWSQELDDRYARFGLQWPELHRPDGSKIAAGAGVLALGMEAGGKSVELRLLDSSLNLTSQGFQERFQVVETEKIRTFIEDNVDGMIDIHENIGYLSSHGTLGLSPALPPQFQMMQPQTESLTRFNTLLSDGYTIKPIDLKSGDHEIPSGINTLIIAGAKEEFSDWELFQIDQFLMQGKSLALFVDSFNEIRPQGQQQMYGMQQPSYIPLNSGLEKLLDFYGARVDKSYILDESCYVSRDPNTGEMPIYFAPIVKNENINHRLDFLKNIKELILIQTSPVQIEAEVIEKNGLRARTLLESSEKAWEMSGQINLTPFMIRPPMNEDDLKSFPLAALIEGEFTSYFADKPVPEKPAEEEPGEETEAGEEAVETPPPPQEETRFQTGKGLIAKGRPGRILLIGTSMILKDNILDEAGQSPNAVFLLNTLDYLNGKSDIAVMRGKNQRFNPLKDTKAFTRTFVKMLNIGGLPVLIILLGISIWIRRKNKRRMIHSQFAGSAPAGEKSK